MKIILILLKLMEIKIKNFIFKCFQLTHKLIDQLQRFKRRSLTYLKWSVLLIHLDIWIHSQLMKIQLKNPKNFTNQLKLLQEVITQWQCMKYFGMIMKQNLIFYNINLKVKLLSGSICHNQTVLRHGFYIFLKELYKFNLQVIFMESLLI